MWRVFYHVRELVRRACHATSSAKSGRGRRGFASCTFFTLRIRSEIDRRLTDDLVGWPIRSVIDVSSLTLTFHNANEKVPSSKQIIDSRV